MRSGSALADALAVLRPTPDETALLGACLLAGADARAAWLRWRARHPPDDEALRRALVARRGLLPLLARSATLNDLDVGRGLLSQLRAATLREDLRATRYREIAAEALGALQRAGATPWVVRGPALAATAYADFALRHCHDLDLLVRSEDLPDAVRALERLGCPAIAPLPERPADALLLHGSGLRIALHARPFAVPYYEAPFASFTRASRTVAIGGVSAATPAPEATLVHVLGHAGYSASRESLRWVADAWNLVVRHQDLDWDDVRARVAEYRLTLPVSVLLRSLADLGLSIPGDALAGLERAAAGAGRAAGDVALGGAFAGVRGRARVLWRGTHSWRGRLRLARWAIAPSPAYLRSLYPEASPWLLPVGYLRRPARFVAAAVRGRGRPVGDADRGHTA